MDEVFQIPAELLLAIVIRKFGYVTVDLADFSVDFSDCQIAVDQNDDGTVTFSLVKTDA